MFLPVSFILSMIPSFDGMSKRAITKLFNTILTRAGITLIITTAFSISTMLYSLSAGYPFFLIAFLQIVTFAGIYFKLGDLMSMFSLQSNDSQSMGSRIMRKPRMLMHTHMHRLQRKLGRSMKTPTNSSNFNKGQVSSGSSVSRTQADHSRPDGQDKASFGKRTGQRIGAIADTKDRIKDGASNLREQVKDLPTNARYAVYQGKSKVQDNVRELTCSISQTKLDRASGRKEEQEQRRKTIAERLAEMEKAKQNKKPASTTHTRPTTKQESYEKANQQQEQVHVRPNTKQEKTYDEESTRPTTAPINKNKTQKKKVESSIVKTVQRPTTREDKPNIQRKSIKNLRKKTTIATDTTRKNGDKS